MLPSRLVPAASAAASEAREMLDELGRLSERAQRAARDAAALADHVARVCARSRATRATVTLNRLQWHAWRSLTGAARQGAGEPGRRCTLTLCESCGAASFVPGYEGRPAPEAVIARTAVWIRPPDAVVEHLRRVGRGSGGGLDVVNGRCPGCAATSAGGSPVGDLAAPDSRDLAGTLLCVLGEISEHAEALAAGDPGLGDDEALTRACEDALSRLTTSGSPDELQQLLGALDALLVELRCGQPRRGGVAAPPRPSRFRPALRRR